MNYTFLRNLCIRQMFADLDYDDYFNFYDFTASVEDNETGGENAEEIREGSSEELIENLPRSIYCDLGSILRLKGNFVFSTFVHVQIQ